ncbi:MAG TPA: hypothetical protein VHS03_13795 [Gaiellaceae bacterium]|jgi:hypothetical protein|nr:hypothetical protein [Gaiellaceae bacterium]
MRFRRLLVLVAAGGAAFGIASAVQASIPDASGVAHACYLIKGKLRRQIPGRATCG